MAARLVALSLLAPAVRALYGEPRPVQIIPSVLPADWANMGADCQRLEQAGVDRSERAPAGRLSHYCCAAHLQTSTELIVALHRFALAPSQFNST